MKVMAVGDGANDLHMMRAAGFGVAFDAKPKVQEEADGRINGGNLMDVLYLLGYSSEEQDEIKKMSVCIV